MTEGRTILLMTLISSQPFGNVLTGLSLPRIRFRMVAGRTYYIGHLDLCEMYVTCFRCN